jgi:2,3-bisphosphoglycerate-independent phosphoglycerate mutase
LFFVGIIYFLLPRGYFFFKLIFLSLKLNLANLLKDWLDNKIIYVLLDGIGDLPNDDLNDLTPLEAAITPNLDKIARNGSSGQVTSVGEGIAPQSDIAVFNMLGYNFKDKDYVGRGVVECLGCNIDFKDGDLALRGNFATIDTDKKILDRRAGRVIPEEDSIQICDLINKNVKLKDDVEFSVKPTIGHRVILHFRKRYSVLGENITNTDPAYEKINGIGIAKSNSKDELYVIPSQYTDESSKSSAEIVNCFSDHVIQLLNNCEVNERRVNKGLLPINCILLRDAGNRYPHVQSINEKYRLNFASLVDMPVEIGISKILGITSYDAGKPEDYKLKAKSLLEKISYHDFFYVHIKGPDEFGHDGNAKGKKKNIEEIDKHFFGPLQDGLYNYKDVDVSFIISGDHSTPCIKKAHTDDPIPLVVSGKNVEKDGTSRFTESYSKKGTIGKILGYEVIGRSLNLLGRD